MKMWLKTICFVIVTGIVFYAQLIQSKSDNSFSFFKFSGPVSGEVEKIIVSDGNSPHFGERKVDYIAKPYYSFHYGIQHTKTGNSQGHKESRDGDAVEGEYRVLEENGLVRIVRYTANPEKGFQAHIEYVKLKQ